jgi:NADH-ubiquinone oxidoreductase chain 5
MLLNRVGDFSLLISIFLIFIYYKSIDYATVAALTPFFQADFINFLNFKVNVLTVIGLLMFLGATGKSAQLILHTWLADAMEGPTPVSALIHAATMVTAGVFLIARSSMIFEYIQNVLEYITVVGAVTSFFAATTGLLQNDLKRVIAYSTCSQLGYMIFACGLSSYSVGFFHLTNHAFFKALLFLSAGSVIHAVNDEQDMRKMGGLKNLVPFTYSMLVIGSLALIGFPFLAGFYSKDLVLEASYGKYNLTGYFSYCLGTVGAFFTAFYSMRLCYLTFLSRPTGHKKVLTGFAFDSGVHICVALGCLAIPSIFIGYYLKDMFVGVGSCFFGTAVFVSLQNIHTFDGEFINVFYKTLPVILSLFGFFFSYAIYSFGYRLLLTLKVSVIGRTFYEREVYRALLEQK